MTLKQQIKKLQDEIGGLKERIAALEARPVITVIPYTAPVTIPYNPIYPAPTWPTMPYIGDPFWSTTTCQTQQNAVASMSTQESRLMQ